MTRSQLAHFACAHQEDGTPLQRSEDLTGQIDSHRGDGDRVRTDSGFRSRLLGGGKGTLQQMFKLAADGSLSARHGKGLFHLAEDLRFAYHHGVETGRQPEQVAHCLLVSMLIKMWK